MLLFIEVFSVNFKNNLKECKKYSNIYTDINPGRLYSHIILCIRHSL